MREAGPPARGGPAAPSREGRTTFTAMRDPRLTSLRFDCSSGGNPTEWERAEVAGSGGGTIRPPVPSPLALSGRDQQRFNGDLPSDGVELRLGQFQDMPPGVLEGQQRLAVRQDNGPIESLIPRHETTKS